MHIEDFRKDYILEHLLVSVIIPVYKVEEYLKQCVDSVLNQTYRYLEVILVDDGSPDNCPRICDLYAEQDQRVQVVHQNNSGASGARNTGLNIATGDYVVFLDGDDFWDDTEALERLINRVKKTKPDVLNYSYKKYYEDSEKEIPQFENIAPRPVELIEKKEQLDYITRNFLYIASPCNKLIRTKILSKNMQFEEGKSSEDVEWCAKLLCEAESFDFVCENFYCYRQRATSTTHTMQEKACIDLASNILGCMKIAEHEKKEVREYIYRYTAYQLATFVAVQAIATVCPPECIENLKPYQWLFSYHGKNRKVTCLYIANKVLGFKNLCRIVRWSKKLWHS